MSLRVVPLAAIGFALAWLLQEIPLRGYAHVGTEGLAAETPIEPEISHRPVTAAE